MTAAAIYGTTAATTATVGGATLVGTTTTWGLSAITAGMVAADAALVAGGIGAFSSLQQGAASERLGKSMKNISEFNAELDEREASEKLDVAGFEESKFRQAGERLKSTQITRHAQAGVTMEGTPMDTLENTATQLELDALVIRRSGQTGAGAATASAQLNRVAGRNALLTGRARRRASQTEALGLGVGALGQAYRYKMEV